MPNPPITVRLPSDVLVGVERTAKRDKTTRTTKIVAYLREGVARDEVEPKKESE